MITRDLCRDIRSELELVLPAIGKQLGVKLALGKGRFCPNFATLKIDVTPLTEAGTEQSKIEVDFKLHAASFGLKASDLGREFGTSIGSRFKICGLNPRAWKSPILATNNGKTYKFKAESVKTLLAIADFEAKPTVVQSLQ